MSNSLEIYSDIEIDSLTWEKNNGDFKQVGHGYDLHVFLQWVSHHSNKYY